MAGEQATMVTIYSLPISAPVAVTQLSLLSINTLNTGLTLNSSGATATVTQVISLSWFIPQGTTNLTVNVNYSSALDVNGARPYAVLHVDASLGLSQTTVTAPSGGGSQVITFSFSATPRDGVAILDLAYPPSGIPGTVIWTPQVKPGQTAFFTVGTGNNIFAASALQGTSQTLAAAAVG